MKAPNKRQLRKLEKKRKIERKKRAETRSSVQPYTGRKYRRNDLVPLHMATEQGILEAFVVTDRTLTDDNVADALIQLIQTLRAGRLRELADYALVEQPRFGVVDLVVARVLDHWQHLFATEGAQDRGVLVGVLRTLLGSIDVWRTPDRASQGYLEHLEDFLGNLGVAVRDLSREEAEQLGIPGDHVHAVGRLGFRA